MSLCLVSIFSLYSLHLSVHLARLKIWLSVQLFIFQDAVNEFTVYTSINITAVLLRTRWFMLVDVPFLDFICCCLNRCWWCFNTSDHLTPSTALTLWVISPVLSTIKYHQEKCTVDTIRYARSKHPCWKWSTWRWHCTRNMLMSARSYILGPILLMVFTNPCTVS